jgi:MFS family permease
MASGPTEEELPPPLPTPAPPLPGAPLRRGVPTFQALRHRNYALYFFGQMVSLTGTWLQTTVMIWLVHQWTQQSSWAAWLLVAPVAPTLVLGAWGGSLSDRFGRRELLVITQTILGLVALAVTAVAWFEIVSPELLLALALLNGIVIAVDFPARLAFVVELVGVEDVPNAVALNALMFNIARLVGPALAALALAVMGPSLCFLVNALSYVAVVLALLAMDPTKLHRPNTPKAQPRLFEGFTFLRERPRLLLLLALTGLVALFGWPVQALLPALAEHYLNGGAAEYGLLVSAIGCGALLAALAVATFGTAPRRAFFLGTGTLLAAGSLLVLAQARLSVVASLAAAGIGCGLVLFFATSQAVTQLSAADHNRGLIMGIYGSVISGAQPAGMLVFGPLADRWNVPGVIMLQGSAILASAFVVGLIVTVWYPRRKGE